MELQLELHSEMGGCGREKGQGLPTRPSWTLLLLTPPRGGGTLLGTVASLPPVVQAHRSWGGADVERSVGQGAARKGPPKQKRKPTWDPPSTPRTEAQV